MSSSRGTNIATGADEHGSDGIGGNIDKEHQDATAIVGADNYYHAARAEKGAENGQGGGSGEQQMAPFKLKKKPLPALEENPPAQRRWS